MPYPNKNLLSAIPDNKQAFNTEFGEMTVGMRIDDVSINFHYGISTEDTKDLSTGTGSISDVGSDAAIQSGAGVGTGWLSSLDSVRYRAGHELLTMFTHDQTELQIGVDVIHGLFDGEDGVAIGSNDTEIGVWFIENNNENFIPQSDWILDKLDGSGKSGFKLDITKRNLFAITFGYLSIAPMRYYCHIGKQGWVEFHNIILNNEQSEGHLKNPTLTMGCEVRRVSGSGSNVQVKTGSWRAGTVGAEHQVNASDRWKTIEETRVNISAVNIGTDPDLYQNMFTIRNNASFKGIINHIRTEVAIVNFIIDANKGVEFVSQINSTLTGNDAFAAIDAVNSVLDVSYNGTSEGEVAGARTTASKNSDRRTDVRGTNIYIRPGQTFTLGVRGINGSAVTGDISATFRVIQQF